MTSRSARASDRRRAWGHLAPAFLCLGVLLAPARAHAQEPQPVDLEWTAPAGCPRLEEVQAKIRKLAGLRKWSAVPLRAEAIVVRKDDGDLHLRLLLHAGDLVEERNIDGSSCNTLAGATAVVVALMFRSGGLPPTRGEGALTPTGEQDPDGSTNGTPSTEPNAPAPEPKPSDAAPPAPSEPAASGSPRRWHGLAQLPLGMAGIGPLRAPSVGLAVAGGASFDRWRFLARGTAWLPQHSTRTDDFQPYGARLSRTTLTLLACRSLFDSRFEIAPCAVVSLAHLSARGEGAHIAARTASATWLAAGLGLHARLHVTSWLNLSLSADGELAASRPELVVGGVGQVDSLGPAAATFGLGTEWIL